MAETFPELPGWTFSIEEVSACVYQVTGIDQRGRRFQATGTDTDALLADARAYAERILAAGESRR